MGLDLCSSNRAGDLTLKYGSFVASGFCNTQYSTLNFKAHFVSYFSSTCSNHSPPLTFSASILFVSLAPGACWDLLCAHHVERLFLVGSLESACFSTMIQDISWLRHLAPPTFGIFPLGRFLFVTLFPNISHLLPALLLTPSHLSAHS